MHAASHVSRDQPPLLAAAPHSPSTRARGWCRNAATKADTERADRRVAADRDARHITRADQLRADPPGRPLRPIAGERARQTGAPERTLYRQAARFDALGMASLSPPPSWRSTARCRAEIRRQFIELKREYPGLNTPGDHDDLLGIRFGRAPATHTVKRILAEDPGAPPRRRAVSRRTSRFADPAERRPRHHPAPYARAGTPRASPRTWRRAARPSMPRCGAGPRRAWPGSTTSPSAPQAARAQGDAAGHRDGQGVAGEPRTRGLAHPRRA